MLSILSLALLWSSVNFIASPILPEIFTLPWKKAFCGLSLPEIKSTTSVSSIVKVTSGLARKFDFVNYKKLLKIAHECVYLF